MKKITIALFLLLPFFIFSQEKVGKVAEDVQSEKSRIGMFKPFDIFKSGFENARNNYSDETKGGVIVAFDKAGVASIYNENPKEMELNIPFKENGETISLDLIQVDVFTPDFKAMTSEGRDITNEMDRGKHYRGTVAGNPQSLVSISIFKNEIMGFITNGEGNYTIGKLKDSNTKHIINKDTNLRTTQEFICGMQDDGVGYSNEQLSYDSSRRVPGGTVEIYVEAGQSVFNSFGGNMTLTTNFLNGVFGQSYVLYANEGISMQTSSMLIWTTPDPYTGANTTTQLNTFKSQTGAFQGDIGHLVEIQNIGGVAAGFNGLCNPDTDQSLCFSGFSGNAFSNVPTVSFNVFIITHEMGHLLGSRHTHACVWNGNSTAIDSCSGFTEGACALPGSPAGGGTIMSYCINEAVGIDFTQGFGPQPGAVILNNVNTADCITTGNCTGPVVACQEFTETFSGCADFIGANTPNGVWVPIGDDESINNAVGGIYTAILDLSNCVSDNCTDLKDLEYTLHSSYEENRVPGCSVDIINEFKVRDPLGNVADTHIIFRGTIKDTTPPDAPAAPADLNLQCASDVPAPVDLTATDNCNGDITVSPSAVITPGDCENQFTMVRTWTFIDDCGNQSSVSQTINVNDDTPPTIECPTVAINFPGCNPTRPTANDAVASVVTNDNCGIKSVIATPGNVTGKCYKTQIFNVVVTDLCGNTANCDVTYTWFEDFEAPVVTAQHERIIDLGCNPIEADMPTGQSLIDGGFLTVTDDCNANLPVIKLDRSERINVGCKQFLVYYYKATDDCGNTTPLNKMAKVTYQWSIDDIRDCTTNYARYNDGNTRFSDDDEINTSDFGWTNHLKAPGVYTLGLYADDITGSVGEAIVNYTGETVTVDYRIFEGFNMSEANVYLGFNKYPKNEDGQYSVDMDDFNYPIGDLDNVHSFSVGPIKVENAKDGIYVIARGVVCIEKCRCSISKDDGGTFPLNASNDTIDYNNGISLSSGSIEDNTNFKVYPVPFENEVFVEYAFDYQTDVTIEVYDLKGALLKKVVDKNYASGSQSKTKLNLRAFSDQMFFVKLRTNKGVGVKKIVSN